MPFKATNSTLKTAVDAWTDGTIDANSPLSTISGFGAANSTNNDASDTFGAMSLWDVSAVTRMNQLFKDKTNFNESGIQFWNVSSVTTMSQMFQDATSFNADLSGWDVSKVTNMTSMFLGATAFDNGNNSTEVRPLGPWDLSSLVNADGMFWGATSFNQPLSWNGTELKLENVNNMFYVNTKFNQKVDFLFKEGNKINNMEGMFNRASEWNNGGIKNKKTDQYNNVSDPIIWYTDNVTNMKNLFKESGFNKEINIQGGVAFNTWKVTDMSYMFSGLSEFNESLAFMNTGAVRTMEWMFYDSPKFNDGNTLGIGVWDVSSVTSFAGMFHSASAFRGKVNTWDVTSVTSGGFNDMFKYSGLVNDDNTPKDDIFRQDFRWTPTAEKFGYKFLEKEATGLVSWDKATGRTTGAYQLGINEQPEIRGEVDGIGKLTPFVTASGNQMFNLDDPFNKGFYLRSGSGIIDAYPSYWAAAVAFTLSVRTKETAVGMNVYNPLNNTKEGNQKLIKELVGFIDLGDPIEVLRFGKKRFMYYEEGIFNPTRNVPSISYLTLEKDNQGNYTQWTTKEEAKSASELLAKGTNVTPQPADYIHDEYIVISENTDFTPAEKRSNVSDLTECQVKHAYTTAQAIQLLFTPGSPFGTWLLTTYQPSAEFRSVLSTTISADYPTGNLTDPVVVEYIQQIIDRHVVVIEGNQVLIDNNNELYDVTNGQKLGTTYSGTYYNSNMVSDLKKPLDRIRLLAHIDFAPQRVGIYDVLVPFCEAQQVNADKKTSGTYRKHYPSDLQQLYSSYYSDSGVPSPGVVNKSFACGSPNFPGLSTQAAEDDADFYFDVLRGVFSGNFNAYKGTYQNRQLALGFQDLRIVYFERGFYNPILDANGNEVQPTDPTYGTVNKPYVSYIHFKDGQTLIKRKQTVDSTDGLYGLYAFVKQLPLTSYLDEYTYSTNPGNPGRSPDQTKTNAKLQTMVNEWYEKANNGTANAIEEANKLYGSPKYWITEKVNNMDGLFSGKKGPNHPDIDYWNMYNVKSSAAMFFNSTFNGELANWERFFPEVGTSNNIRSTMQYNKNMKLMFNNASEFNDDIGGWLVYAAEDMEEMFKDAAKFDQPSLCKWSFDNEDVVLKNMFSYSTTQTPMNRNGTSYGFKVPTPDFVQFGNCAPKFTTAPVTAVSVGNSYSYTATAEDPEGDNVTMTASPKPTWLSFEPAPTAKASYVLSGRPTSENVGSHNVVLSASDNQIPPKLSTQSFTIVVTGAPPAPNNDPVFTSNPVTSALQDTPYNAPDGYKVTATDSDGDEVTIVVNTKPDWLEFNANTNVLSGTPANKDVGNHPVKFTASDGKGGSAVQEFTIKVQNVNDTPVFTSKPLETARQESLYTYRVRATDPDGDNVTVTADKIPGWLTFDQNTNVLSGIPPNNKWGKHNVKLTATDGQLESHQEFTIQVRSPICFNAGTGILCLKNGKEQYVRVGRLMEGDQVKTLNHGYKKIVDIRKGNFKLNGLMDMGMYRMKKQGNMTADLEMTGLHCVLVDKNDKKYADDIKRQGGLNKEKYFIDGKFRLRARESHEFQQMEAKQYTIFSFALEDEEQQQYGIWANGALVETTSRKMMEASKMIKIGKVVEEEKQK